MSHGHCDKCQTKIPIQYRLCLNCFQETVEKMTQTELIDHFGVTIDRKTTPFWSKVFRYRYTCNECGCSYGARQAYHGTYSRCLHCRPCYDSNYTSIVAPLGHCDKCDEEIPVKYRYCHNCFLEVVENMTQAELSNHFGATIDRKTTPFWSKVFRYRYTCNECGCSYGTRHAYHGKYPKCLKCRPVN